MSDATFRWPGSVEQFLH